MRNGIILLQDRGCSFSLEFFVFHNLTMSTKQLKQGPGRREYDRKRKKEEYARKSVQHKKGLMLKSFREDDNFYEGTSRMKEMKELTSVFEMGPEKFKTFPNHMQVLKGVQNDPNFKRAYEITSTVMGCVPLSLMASLLNDLKPQENFQKIVGLAQEIGKPNFEKESSQERGVYFMVHWEENVGWKEGGDKTTRWMEELIKDWTVMNGHHQIFSPVAVAQINNFGTAILKGLGFKQVTKKTHSIAPGVVYTENSYNQAAHIDFDETEKPAVEKSWILHLPLQKEGLLLSVWDLPIKDDARNTGAQHEYVFVPFGSYICLRSDVLHSGVYGSTGNSRFHMILKSRNMVQIVGGEGETLHYFPEEEDKKRPPWKGIFKQSQRDCAMYTKKYIEELQDHTGGCNALKGLLDCIVWRGEKKASRKKTT